MPRVVITHKVGDIVIGTEVAGRTEDVVDILTWLGHIERPVVGCDVSIHLKSTALPAR